MKTNNIFVEDIVNYTRNQQNPIKGVYERGLNTAINISKSTGRNGVVTGRQYQSAPKQYHVVQKYHDREPFTLIGEHSNNRMVDDYFKKHPNLIDNYEDHIASSMLDLRRAGEDTRKTLSPAPTWLLKSPTKHVPAKATIFSTSSITPDGKMIIDWDNPFIFNKGGFLNG